jgi:Zn-dependent protease with chaperone function
VLVRKAGAIGRREHLASWLYGVAFRASAHLMEESAVWWPGVVWLLGAVLVGGRVFLGQVLAFCWRGAPVRDEGLCGRVRGLTRRLGLRRRVRVVVGRRLAGPIALGVFRPTVRLPDGFSAELDDAQQEAVLAHELGHLAAHDPAWHLLADLVTAALWWHPLAWWSRRRFQLASESAADETCLLLADGPLVLAGCLVALAGRRGRAWPSAAGRSAPIWAAASSDRSGCRPGPGRRPGGRGRRSCKRWDQRRWWRPRSWVRRGFALRCLKGGTLR